MSIARDMSEATLSSSLYPNPSKSALESQFVGQQIKDVQAPAAILDAAIIRRNCDMMLKAARTLDVGFRAHVKTHKVVHYLAN